MNNAVYFHLFDSIINSYLIEHCGRSPSFSDQIGLVVSSHCDFFSSVGYPDIVDLGLRVNKLGKSSISYEVAVFEQKSEAVRAVGGYTHVFVNRKDNKPTAEGMSDEIRRGLTRIVTKTASKI